MIFEVFFCNWLKLIPSWGINFSPVNFHQTRYYTKRYQSQKALNLLLKIRDGRGPENKRARKNRWKQAWKQSSKAGSRREGQANFRASLIEHCSRINWTPFGAVRPPLSSNIPWWIRTFFFTRVFSFLRHLHALWHAFPSNRRPRE